MSRRTINHLCGPAPIGLSLLALLLVTVALATGWDRGLKDEGAVAHVFQTLIAAEAPLVLLFLGTADWRRAPRVLALLSLQAAALGLALAPVAIFKL